MLKVKLICMPFFQVETPSFGLTLLDSMIKAEFNDKIDSQICYVNHDFANFIGLNLSEKISFSQEIFATGIGEWFFYKIAFPEMENNSNSYLLRYFPGDKYEVFRKYILEKQFELDHFFDEIIENYQLDKADVVGFTSMFSQNLACFALAKKIRDKNKHTTIIIGGANCQYPMGLEIVKNVQSIDFAFSGSAIKSFNDFLKFRLEKNYDGCNNLRGVFSKMNCNQIEEMYEEEPTVIIGGDCNMDNYPEIDYDAFFNSLDIKFEDKSIEPILFFQTSNGCWWGEKSQCAFCGLNGLDISFKAMSAEKAINTINNLIDKYSGRCKRFMCIDNILPGNYPEDVLSKLNIKKDISLFYEVRPTLGLDHLKILSESGIKQVGPGIESLSTSTLKQMRKGLSVFRNIIFLKNCLQADVFPMWNLLVGTPFEDPAVYDRYLEIFPSLYHLIPPRYLSQIVFMPNSIYFHAPEKYDLELVPYDYYNFIYPFDKKVIDRMAYFFRNKKLSDSYLTMIEILPKLQAGVTKWQERWLGNKNDIPELYIKEVRNNETIIFDSRYDKPVEYTINDVEEKILSCFEKPGEITILKTSDINESEIDAAIENLLDKELLISENNVFLNLVLLERPSSLSFSLDSYFASTMDDASWEKSFSFLETV